jgi:hypothetical protein
VFATVNVADIHLVNSSILAGNMNVVKSSASRVMQSKRDNISALCNRWRKCCRQAMEYCTYFTISRLRKILDTLTLLGYMFVIWWAYSSSGLVVRGPTMSMRTVHNAQRESILYGTIPWEIC